MSNKIHITMQPLGRRFEVEAGTNLLKAAHSAGVELVSLCGGIGACDSCKVKLLSGTLTPLSLEERAIFSKDELDNGFRLACQSVPLDDVRIEILPESLTTPQRLQVEGQALDIEPDPLIRTIELKIIPPDLGDLRSDLTRLYDTLASVGEPALSLSYQVLAELLEKIRVLDWAVELVIRANEIIAIMPISVREEKIRDQSTDNPLLGLAIDIGTTKLAAYLLDLRSGCTLAKAGAMNPQIAFGEDVVSRIAYANQQLDGQDTLQFRLIENLNDLIMDLCHEIGAEPEQIVDSVVVGNTAMHHIFAGLPVSQLGSSPYVPAVSQAIDLRARDVGLRITKGGYIYLPPNIAGYVGADHVAMILATEIWQTEQTVIALDIGTNTEITLAYQGRLISCSCASGPAFEGAHIKDGMRASVGAVEKVQISGEEVRVHTIGEKPAVGICGSGIIDAIGALLQNGILDYRGLFRGSHSRLSPENNAFILVFGKDSGLGRDIVVTRKDINEIQLAKSAIRTGIDLLLAEAGLQLSELQRFIVAGAFGTYIGIEAAIKLGMFPNLPLERFVQVGNAAGAGARQLLVSAERRQIAQELARRVEYLELSNHPKFTSEFAKNLFFQDNI